MQIELLLELTSELLNHKSAEKVKNYLDSRISKSIAKEYKFGYMPPNCDLELLTDVFSIKYLESNGIIYKKNISGGISYINYFNNHNLIFPFYDAFGKCISIVGRTLLSNKEQKENKISKYKYTINHNKSAYLFGLDKSKDSIIKKDFVICVEGQFDYFALLSQGITNCVALGWAQMTELQFFWLRSLTKNIYLFLDNDDAGKSGMLKIKKNYSEYGNIRTIAPISGYKDIDEFVKSDDINKDKVINKLLNGFKEL